MEQTAMIEAPTNQVDSRVAELMRSPGNTLEEILQLLADVQYDGDLSRASADLAEYMGQISCSHFCDAFATCAFTRGVAIHWTVGQMLQQ